MKTKNSFYEKFNKNLQTANRGYSIGGLQNRRVE